MHRRTSSAGYCICTVNQMKAKCQTGEDPMPLAQSSLDPSRGVWKRRHSSRKLINLETVTMRIRHHNNWRYVAPGGQPHDLPWGQSEQCANQRMIACDCRSVWQPVHANSLPFRDGIKKALEKSIICRLLRDLLDRSRLYAPEDAGRPARYRKTATVYSVQNVSAAVEQTKVGAAVRASASTAAVPIKAREPLAHRVLSDQDPSLGRTLLGFNVITEHLGQGFDGRALYEVLSSRGGSIASAGSLS